MGQEQIYSDCHREIQEGYGQRALADRTAEAIVLQTFTEQDAAFINERDFFFLFSLHRRPERSPNGVLQRRRSWLREGRERRAGVSLLRWQRRVSIHGQHQRRAEGRHALHGLRATASATAALCCALQTPSPLSPLFGEDRAKLRMAQWVFVTRSRLSDAPCTSVSLARLYPEIVLHRGASPSPA